MQVLKSKRWRKGQARRGHKVTLKTALPEVSFVQEGVYYGPERRNPRAIPMILHCPACKQRHIDKIGFKLHHTHACQNCGLVWRPAVVYTVGVKFLPGFKDDLGTDSGTDQTSIYMVGP